MIKYLIEKEFRQIMRNRFLPRLIILFPLMVLLFLPQAANFEIKNINITILDNDRSSLSGRLSEKVLSSGYFRLARFSRDSSSALESIEQNKSDLILEIPPNFERDLMKEQTGELMISVNAVNGTKGAFGSSYLSSIIQDFSSDLRIDNGILTREHTAAIFQLIPRFRFNQQLRYPVFMVPALMVMLLLMICGFLPALNIVGEKEKGTMEQINVTPVKKSTLILSKLIPFWIIGFIVLSIGFAVAWIVYGLVPVGNILIIYLYAFIFILAISGFGLVVSNYANTMQQAMFMMFFFVITFIFLSGLYTPVKSMPDWAQIISLAVPLKYMIEVLRMVYLKGSGFLDLSTQFLALLGFAAFFNLWAVLSYRKTN